MLNQREWDVAQLESQLRVQGWFQEWVESLMEGRNPTDQLSRMSPQEVVDLRDGPPPQLALPPEAAGSQEGPPSIVPPPEEEI